MKKLLAVLLLGCMTMSISAAEVGENDSRCIYTKCEMDRSVAQNLKKDTTQAANTQVAKVRGMKK